MSNNKAVIIQGSARSDGNTTKISNYVRKQGGFDFIDLNEKNIGYFDYEFKNKEDDYIPLMKEIIHQYETLIFATPVYWYAMSGVMKTFFDRLTDLLRIEKETGRKLRGKNMAMISCGSDGKLNECFRMPFIESSNYLGMKYLGDVHAWIENGEIPQKVKIDLRHFINKIKTSS